MKRLLLLAFLISPTAHACWNLRGVFTHDDKSISFNQKINHDQTYSFQAADYLLNLNFKPNHEMIFEIISRVQNELRKISSGKVLIKEGEEQKLNHSELNVETKTELTIFLNHI
jgi:hypothetical protein